MIPDDLVSSANAAEILDVDRATFNRWVVAGRIVPVVAMPGRTGAKLYARADVLALAVKAAS